MSSALCETTLQSVPHRLAVPLTIAAVLRPQHDERASVTFQKVDLPLDLVQPIVAEYYKRDAPPREKRLSGPVPTLEPPFTFAIDKKIGAGSAGVVYSLEPHEKPIAPSMCPPLVAKFSVETRSKFLLREAWFYEELQSLQGSVVPWCFGLYAARIPDGQTFIPWADDEKERETSSEDPHEEGVIRRRGRFKDEHLEFVKSFEHDRVVLALILERLGGPFLPISGNDEETGEPVEDEEERTKDAYYAYREIANLHIEHFDVKFDNILKAPAQNLLLDATSDPERRTLVCRIVDFELSRKVNFTTDYIYWATEGYLTRLIENLRWGCPMGQHDGI